MSYNIAKTLAVNAAKFPDRVGLIMPASKGGKQWTFQELLENSGRYANVLADRGVKKGDRVMLMVKPSMEFVCLTFALFQIGAVVILIDPGMGYKNLLRCISSVKPQIFVGIAKAQLFRMVFFRHFTTIRTSIWVGSAPWPFAVSLKHLAARAPVSFSMVDSGKEDLAAIIFTTGSTGPPKGVQYTHGIFYAQP